MGTVAVHRPVMFGRPDAKSALAFSTIARGYGSPSMAPVARRAAAGRSERYVERVEIANFRD